MPPSTYTNTVKTKMQTQTQTQNQKINQAPSQNQKEGFLTKYERKALEILEKAKCMDLADDVKFVFRILSDAIKHAERKSKESILLLLSIKDKISQVEEVIEERTRIETEEYIKYETEDYTEFMIVMEEALWRTAEKVYEKLIQKK